MSYYHQAHWYHCSECGAPSRTSMVSKEAAKKTAISDGWEIREMRAPVCGSCVLAEWESDDDIVAGMEASG